MDRIVAILQAIPKTYLVMPGSSGFPMEPPEIICERGGDIKETRGVPVEEVVCDTTYGARKVNIGTNIRFAITVCPGKGKTPGGLDLRKF